MSVGEGEFTPPALLPPHGFRFLMSIATDAMSVAFFSAAYALIRWQYHEAVRELHLLVGLTPSNKGGL